MRQAITTRYCGPGARGARIKATCQARTIFVSWDHARGMADNHIAAASALAAALNWHGAWAGGFDHREDGVFVLVAGGNNLVSALDLGGHEGCFFVERREA